MKLTFLLMSISFLSLYASDTYSQDTRLTISANQERLEDFLGKIETQSEFRFFYTGKINVDKKVSGNFRDNTITEIMDEVSKIADIQYAVMGRQVVLAPLEEVVMLQQQGKTVTGRVVDENGEPIPGASIVLKGTTTGTISDMDGNFTLAGVPEDGTLVFSFVGMGTQEVAIAGKDRLDMVLQEETLGLDEVVVVGYGTQKKINLTGAISQITSEDIKDVPASNLSQLLQGSVPNLNVTFSSGRPGQSGTFNIRGVNSISGNAKPLILIDGIEGDIDRVNPKDVESVSVLKDASSAAIYGARASYGVILVTTKSGGDEKNTVNYTGKYGFGDLTTSTDYENRGYYSAFVNDLFFKSYSGQNYTKYTDADYEELWARRNDKTEHPDRPWVTIDQRDGRDTYVYYANTDWHDYLFDNTRPTWEHNINLSGGSNKVKYFLSGNMFEEKGVFKISPDKFKKFNFRSKISADVLPWLTVSNNTSYFHSKYSYPGQGDVNNTFNAMHVHGLASFVPTNPDGSPTYLTSLSNYQIMDGLSAALINNGHKNIDKVYEFSTIFEATFKLHSNLNVISNYNYIHTNAQNLNRSVNVPYSKYPNEILNITSGWGLDELRESQINHWYEAFNLFINYDNKFARLHDVKLTVGTNYETKYYKDLRLSRQDLLTTELNDFNLAVGDVMNITGGQNEYALFGVFYRLNYRFNNKYLFETSARYDGSSRFIKNQRFGFFPSFSAGWRINEESFFEPLRNIISNLKLRVSYGSLGNQQVGYYDYIQTINTGGKLNYSFGDGQTAPYASVSNPNASTLTWETVSTQNLGLDIGFLNQKLNFSGDVYIRKTEDMLMQGKKLPATYGASEPRENAADLETRGWEISVNWNNRGMLFNKPLNYRINVGLSDYTSKITKFDNPSKVLNDFYKGQRLGDIWGFKIDGYFLTDEEASNYQVDQTAVNSIIEASAIDPGVHAGDMKFIDLDDDDVIGYGDNTAEKPGDRRIIGNSLPKYSYNANISVDWNGIDLSIFFQGVAKQNWYPDRNAVGFWGPYTRPYSTFIPNNFMDKVWSEDNPNAYFPRPRGYIALNSQNRALGVVNDKYLQDLAYLRLKNLTLGYTLPNILINRLGIEKCRVFFSGANLLTFTKLKSDYIDPEQAAVHNSFSRGSGHAKVYPWSKTYSFGIDVTF